jgi:phage tail sheath protein FI
MAFPVSPGVAFREIDASSGLESATATVGSIAGKFAWGPVGERVRIASEDQLKAVFGKPTDANYTDFLLAASFLAYSSALDVVRIGADGVVKNACDDETAVSVLNLDDYEASIPSTCSFLARYPGAVGNSLQVVTCGSANQYSMALPGMWTFTISNTAIYAPAVAETLLDYFQVGDFLVVNGESYSVTALTTATLTLGKIYTGPTTGTPTVVRQWKYANRFAKAPTTGEFHLVVIDTTGAFADEVGQILEQHTLSTTVGALNSDGTPKYYIDALKQFSSYILGGTAALAFSDNTADAVTLAGGDSAFASLTLADQLAGYDLFKNAEVVDAPLIIAGETPDTSAILAKYLIQNIAEVRKDAVVFISPRKASVQTKGQEATLILADRDVLGSSSYAAMDSNWKYIYDRYNNKFRWIPCCADHAGRYAVVDREKSKWESGAGLDATIKNAVKLAWNPSQNDRDRLYPNNVNPIYSKPGYGPLLFGHKTLLATASPFDRIPNRRIMIELEQIISKSAQALLFKVNNETSQRRFYATVEPYLRDLQGQGGIIDFLVIADSTVNTPTIISQNKFAAKIYIKLNGFAEFILLDFTGIGANSSFEELIVANI